MGSINLLRKSSSTVEQHPVKVLVVGSNPASYAHKVFIHLTGSQLDTPLRAYFFKRKWNERKSI